MKSQEVVQLYGGIIAEVFDSNITEDRSDSASKPRRSRRKRVSKGSDSDNEEKKGKRGRPRVDSQDQNAVERRRTQIRLAQRAYRERKDTTISTLDSRVSHLQQTVNEMNQTFIDYNDKAIASGIANWKPALGEDLKFAVERFLQLSRNVSADSDGEDRGHGCKPQVEPTYVEAPMLSPAGFLTHALRTKASASNTPMANLNHPASMLGYEVSFDNPNTAETEGLGMVGNAEEPDYLRSSDMTHKWVENSMSSQQSLPELSSLPVFTPNWNAAADQAIKPTWTYSFQERTFSRRLLRSSYERTYHLLTDPDSSKHEIYRVLRYTFHISDAKKIAARIRENLIKSSKESLENWDSPMLHIGGAGLHYPRVDPKGETPLPSNWTSPQSMGPYRPRNGPLSIPDNEFPQHLMKYANVEGTWFDSDDVEQYLRTKGLYLDGLMSVAEIEVDEQVPSLASEFSTGSPNSLSSDSFADPQSPRQLNDTMPDLFSHNTDYFTETSHGASVPEQASMPFESTAMDTGFDFAWPFSSIPKHANELDVGDMAMFPESGTFIFAPQKRTLRIDVDRLLDALAAKSVCLGRAPGYRHEDVDAALNKVVREAWGDL